MNSHYSLRYVVLHHTGIEAAHFDLLFETMPGSPLFGFRLSQWPMTEQTHCEISSTHRRDYLTDEGEISGGRGRVRRVAAGHCRVDGDAILLDTGDRLIMKPAETDLRTGGNR